MRRMFRARVISPSYKPHRLVGGAVDFGTSSEAFSVPLWVILRWSLAEKIFSLNINQSEKDI